MSALRTLLLGRVIFRQENSLRHAAMMCQRSLRARTYPMILHCCSAPHVASLSGATKGRFRCVSRDPATECKGTCRPSASSASGFLWFFRGALILCRACILRRALRCSRGRGPAVDNLLRAAFAGTDRLSFRVLVLRHDFQRVGLDSLGIQFGADFRLQLLTRL